MKVLICLQLIIYYGETVIRIISIILNVILIISLYCYKYSFYVRETRNCKFGTKRKRNHGIMCYYENLKAVQIKCMKVLL